ncbi:MAG: DNA-binding transcriptional LysR family regulator [Psychrosphaera sp.]|jgi:DNA-binding transcriptional LysR family regulator|uniref:LysR family transcriptional regulator n=1 Tax=Psychrosphaera aquimarina TaxID=2044854 RepID=A0ABU3R322_9GAMM|nr:MULTISPECIES: LysR family transcriptional regulator [Psychrosphaera]MDU0114079.1 LysR family transcriptional regulator [Psychrosphaera aquimarina]
MPLSGQSNRQPTIRQLQLVQALARYQSLSVVAEKLHISQPSVSIQLKNLSDLLGLPVYQMLGRQLTLTDAGKAVLNSANQIFQTLDNLKTDIDNLQGVVTGTLSISVVTTAQYFLPLLLAAFAKHYPHVDVKLEIANRDKVHARLADKLDDFYLFGQMPQNVEVVETPFLDNELVVVAPERHELTLVPNISLARLSHYPFLLREEGSGTREATLELFNKHGFELHEKMTIASGEAIKQAVAAGLGLSILSKHSLDFGIMPGLKILKVEHFPIRSKWRLVQNASRQPTLLAKAFQQFMLDNGVHILASAVQNNPE